MRRILGVLLAVMAMALIASCGGGGGGSGTLCLPPAVCPSTDQSAPVDIAQLSVTLSSPTLQTDGSSTVKVRATVKNSSNAAVVGQAVTIAADSGTLSEGSGTTNSSGVFETTFDTNDNKANRTVTFTASAGSLVRTSSLLVQGTTVAFAGDTASVIGQPVSLTVSVSDADRKKVAGVPVSLSSSLGNPVPTSGVTSANGEFTFTYTPTVAGSDTISATSLNYTAQTSIDGSGVNFRFTSPSASTNVPLPPATGFCQAVTVAASGFSPTSVQFAVSRGQIFVASNCTGGTSPNTNVTVAVSGGVSTAYVKSTSAGRSIVTAVALGGSAAQTSLALNYVATEPKNLTVQGSPSTVSVNGSSSIVATVRDLTGNPVEGVTVLFGAPNGGGTSNPTFAVTDSRGAASTTFTGDTSISGLSSVIVSAEVLGTTPVVQNTASLTVSGLAVNVVIGTDNNVVLVDNPPRYRRVWGASVTDSAGNPVANQDITISVLGTSFNKGYFDVVSGKWAAFVTQSGCPAEDTNNNGQAEATEPGDVDNDGRLEPNGAATVRPVDGAGSTQVTIRTDSSGFATFWLEYLRSYAFWTGVELKATTTVQGKNSVAWSNFYLDYPGSELTNINAAPSFATSPFGVNTGCNTH